MGGSGDTPAAVRVDVLGPLRVTVDGAAVEVRGPKRRALLALLALAEGRVVTVEQMLDALWPSGPPATARSTVHSHVSRLRVQLGAGAARLATGANGYRLALDAGDLDLAQARSLLAVARGSARSDPVAAVASLRALDALWRGPSLADLVDTPPLSAAALAAEQLRREATDLLVGCLVEVGGAQEALGPAGEAASREPLREPAVLLLMRAQAATGQAPLALQTGRQYRRRLADEAGLDPSPDLRNLERDIAAGSVAAPRPQRVTSGEGPPARTSPTSSSPTSSAGPARRNGGLLGRDREALVLTRLLGSERLVTVAGPGGVGKTHLAREIVRGDRPTVTLLLAPVTDPGAVPYALASALDLQAPTGGVLAACVTVLSAGPRLLVVDNCEHLLDAARDVIGAVLESCPEITVLATSREPLGLPLEAVVRLAPLPLPAPGHGAPDELSRVASVAVFLERAGRVRPDFEPGPQDLVRVAEIVRRLDGIPLAIELAAGRLSTFSLRDLADRLDRSLDLLGGGRLHARHRTLRATVAWSYELLSGDEQRLFRHLAVFADGVDLATAEGAALDLGLGGDPGGLLARLVDASMVQASTGHDPDAVDPPGTVSVGARRYRMLDTLRAFGRDRLADAGEREAAEAGLVQWAVRLAARIDATAVTEREPEADATLRRELGNLRAAWRLARQQGALDDAVAIVVSLSEVSVWRELTEIRTWSDELVDDPALSGHPCAAAVLGVAAQDAYMRGDHTRADRLARSGLDRAVDDQGRWYCLNALAAADLSRGAADDAVAHDLAAAELAFRPGTPPGIGALAALYAGDVSRARRLVLRMVAGSVAPTIRAFGAYIDAEIDNATGALGDAEQGYLRAMATARASGATFVVGIATVGLVTVRARAGRVPDALRGYREAVEHWARDGNWTQQWVTLRNLAELLRTLGDDGPAVTLDAAADRAPDAPGGDRPATPGPAVGREQALDVARAAIDRHLGRASRPAP
ncbi:BTAD domain-containing putative transcriptional regulator [Pseudonocardia parietis]|uniref:ATPase/DNA-binding SARP family transcriptional activator n=1 Tax=Pseudonocardia parietis TaxID=570936 RepID=A0ABS4VX53_9PSEU|nr:BTAD domain-containing putative transcriptional regulator [Pseudonocardia parietis]MBP2368521.1 putative ATPase/DNA-binding SARP family transcriptional activator [Pseudonocardia parietis]